MFRATNLEAQFEAVDKTWSPRVIGQVNNQFLKVAKLKGEFVWHDHRAEDELFYVVKGDLVIELDDGTVALQAGEFYIVPTGVRHRPVAEDECWVLLVEPVTTQHTGDVDTPDTKSLAEQLRANR